MKRGCVVEQAEETWKMGSEWETHVGEVQRVCAKPQALKLSWRLNLVGLPNFEWHKLGQIRVGQNVGQERKSWAGRAGVGIERESI